MEKEWYKSKTLWTSVFVIIVGVFGLSADPSFLAENMVSIATSVSTIIGAAIAILSRFGAKEKLVKKVKKAFAFGFVLLLVGCKTSPELANWAEKQAANSEAVYKKVEEVEDPTDQQWQLMKEYTRIQMEKWEELSVWADGGEMPDAPSP